jgi:hypothetical protein
VGTQPIRTGTDEQVTELEQLLAAVTVSEVA